MKAKPKQRKKIIHPAEVFKMCPDCRSSNLLIFETDLFCLACDWDSVELTAHAWLENRKPPTGPATISRIGSRYETEDNSIYQAEIETAI